MPKFNENFNAGDIIYGVWEAREPYVGSLPPDLVDACKDSGAYLTCDDYNNRSWLGRAQCNGKKIVAPDSKQAIDANVDVFQNGGVLNQQQAASVRAFFDKLCSSKRSPKKALSADPEKVKDAGKGRIEELQIRRACKYGLEYVLLTLKQQVHFVLDAPTGVGVSLDVKTIVEKQQFEEWVPITTSELRCCFRNRSKWMPTGRLKFYLNLVEVSAPWISNPTLWAQYEQHRAEKHPVKAFFHLL